jgi:hypothetical protein
VAQLLRPIVSSPGIEADVSLDVALESITIEFDFMELLLAARRPTRERSQRQFDDPRE